MNRPNKPLDELNPRLMRAKKKCSDLTIELARAYLELEEIMADVYYKNAFDDGVDSARDEINRVLKGDGDQVSPTTAPYVQTEVDRIMSASIISMITETSGLRTADITNKIIALPVKPPLTEKSIRLAINRLKNTKKIEDKAGRWYLTGGKAPSKDYQVMRYLPDGSKYLGADVIKG